MVPDHHNLWKLAGHKQAERKQDVALAASTKIPMGTTATTVLGRPTNRYNKDAEKLNAIPQKSSLLAIEFTKIPASNVFPVD